MRQAIIGTLLLVVTAGQALADGKMFWREKIPPRIPYQRALILFRDGVETLVLQSKYEIPKSEGKAKLGWVVPLPAPPEVASIPARGGYRLFRHLGAAAPPRVTRVRMVVGPAVLVILSGLALITLLLLVASFVLRVPVLSRNRKRMASLLALWALLFCLLSSMLLPTLGKSDGPGGVDVVSTHQVGIYDVRVIRSGDTGELIAWLNGNNFAFGDDDKTAFGSHIARGWCFVVATINPRAEENPEEIAVEGLAAPLILRFPHDRPVYPLALTGTGGYKTEILIYLASAEKMTCGGRMELRYAGRPQAPFRQDLISQCEPKGFFGSEEEFLADPDSPYLCKFRDTLTPAQMNEDLIFTPAEDDTPYREHIVQW